MAKLYLPSRAQLFVEYAQSETETKIEELLRELGLEFEQKKLDLQGLEILEDFSNNFGYDVWVQDDRRYKGLGAWYQRWINVERGISLDQALKQFADDGSVYQTLTFLIDDGDDGIFFEVSQLGPVDVNIPKGDSTAQMVKERLLTTYPHSHLLLKEGKSSEDYQFAEPLIDMSRIVIETIRQMN